MSAVMVEEAVPPIVRLRMEQWAQWAKVVVDYLGLPRQSIFMKAATYGRLGIPQDSYNKPAYEIPDLVAEVDDILKTMPVVIRRPLVCHFMTWQAKEVQAKECGLGLTTFNKRVENGLWFLYGKLKL